MKIVVLGSGIVGVTSAYFLARDGHEVTVVDRQPVAANETSFANAGLIAPGHAFAWASPKAPGMLLRSLYRNDQALRLRPSLDLRLWSWGLLFLRQCTAARARINTLRKLALCLYAQRQLKQVAAETGIAYDGRTGGALYLHRSQKHLDIAAAAMAIMRENGLPIEVLDRERVAEIEPALAPVKHKLAGALYSASDESGDAHMFSIGLAAFCRERLGVTFAFDTTIRAIDVAGDRVERVVTDGGDVIGDRYVLSLGCDSPSLARPIGIRLPIYPIKGYSATIPVAGHNGAPVIGGVDEEHLVAWARMGDRLRLTATAEFAGYDRGYKDGDFRTMFRAARDLFPDGGDYDRPILWAGLRPMTPEGTPILGRERYTNLYLNTGHGHMGWTMSCGTARITADLIAGRTPEIDLTGMSREVA